MTAPDSTGPRVSTQELENWERAGMLSDCAKDLLDDRRALASLRAQNADLLASEKQRNENICTECGCPRLAKGECLMCENATLRAQNERLREAGSRLAAAVDALSRHHAAKYHVMDSLDMKRWSDVNDGQVAWDRALASTDTGESRDE